ncbi:DMT family transporter [Anianabacter salinae]|uniref:DMT family transporter n=1 Tax=Anianabacter salinae TaxID=2851023 RepID=UPI00225E22FD|nr:DMT family transporter [Anianabacter salinae]MBV0912489.1 DMT family transporter [Anianabacter salinae]
MIRPTPANWLSIFALGIIWGGTFMVVSIALRGYGPVTVACARTTLGAAALLGLALVTGRRLPPLANAALWAYMVPIGLLNSALPFFLLGWGQQYVPSAFAGLSMAALPLFVLPLAHFFADERMRWKRTAGFALGFIGALVLLGPAALTTGEDGTLGAARLACLAAAFSYAVASVLTRRCPPVDPLVLSGLGLAIGAVVLVPAMLLIEGPPVWQGPALGGAILFLGLVPTALASLLRTVVIRSAGSAFMTLTNYQVPCWSMAFGALILGEDLPGHFFVALALILAGLLLGQWRALAALFQRTPS